MFGGRCAALLVLGVVAACGQTTTDYVAGTELGGSGGGPSGGIGGAGSGGASAAGSGGGLSPSCEDGVRNGRETETDCGGPECPVCIDPDPIFGQACDCDSGGGIMVELDGERLEMNSAYPEYLVHALGYTCRGTDCTPQRAHAVVHYCTSFPGSVAGCTGAGPSAPCIEFYPGSWPQYRTGTFRDAAGRQWGLMGAMYSWDGVRPLNGGQWLLGDFSFELRDGRVLRGTVQICTVLEKGCIE